MRYDPAPLLTKPTRNLLCDGSTCTTVEPVEEGEPDKFVKFPVMESTAHAAISLVGGLNGTYADVPSGVKAKDNAPHWSCPNDVFSGVSEPEAESIVEILRLEHAGLPELPKL